MRKAARRPQVRCRERVRRGPNVVKQYRRHWKAMHQRRSVRYRHRKANWIPPKEWNLRKNLVRPERFNNVGRNNSYEPPIIWRINQLRKEMSKLQEEIDRLERVLLVKRKRYAECEMEVNELKEVSRNRYHPPALV